MNISVDTLPSSDFQLIVNKNAYSTTSSVKRNNVWLCVVHHKTVLE